MSAWEVNELVFSDVPSAEDAHHGLPLQLGYLVVYDGSERSAARRLHHEAGPVQAGHGRLDLVIIYEDDPLHITLTQLKGQCAWDGKKGIEPKISINNNKRVFGLEMLRLNLN